MENTFINPTDLSGLLGTNRNMYDILYVDSIDLDFNFLLGLYLSPLINAQHSSWKKYLQWEN